ncbi:MAG: type II toxin-antitoxin system HicA family toxin [Euryarchaeota archaeon]|nr:type II toxin-antitoxin system HicA family toxin [Euryarchaeota archaeon]
MPKLPVVSSRDVVKALVKAGFYIHHQKGSHIALRRDGIQEFYYFLVWAIKA